MQDVINLLKEMIISIPGIPKASGKQLSAPKHLTFSRKIGVSNVEIKLPAFIEK